MSASEYKKPGCDVRSIRAMFSGVLIQILWIAKIFGFYSTSATIFTEKLGGLD
jgi:hypothetical protein